MALIESDICEALSQTKVKRKANNTKKLRATAKRVTGGASEVMVKITSFGKGAQHVKAHLEYITRNGNVEMENDRGEIFQGKKEVNELFEDWKKDFEKNKRHKNQRDTMHMVLSMPETVDPESVKSATRQFAKDNFGKNHEYAFVLHTDTPQPHCHLTVKCKGFDGKRLNPRKADLQRWREEFAEKLRSQGVDAEATPRCSRGVVKKAIANVIKHIEQGDKTHKPRVPKIKQEKIKQVVEEVLSETKGVPVQPKPWENAIQKKQQIIRENWLAVAKLLEKEKKSITFNHKEAFNERPDYDNISTERIEAGQRAAAIYQRNHKKHGCRTSPGPIASLRNVSDVNVVQHGHSSQMFLRENALNSLGTGIGADSEMRRPGAGYSNAPGREKQLKDQEPPIDDKSLAARIRGFVAGMPSLETERHQIKSEIIQKFTKQPNVEVKLQKLTQGQKKGAGQSAPAPEPKEKDLEI